MLVWAFQGVVLVYEGLLEEALPCSRCLFKGLTLSYVGEGNQFGCNLEDVRSRLSLGAILMEEFVSGLDLRNGFSSAYGVAMSVGFVVSLLVMTSSVIAVNPYIEGGSPSLLFRASNVLQVLATSFGGVARREPAFKCKVSHGRVTKESVSPGCVSRLLGWVSRLLGCCYVIRSLEVVWCFVSVVQQVAFSVRGFLLFSSASITKALQSISNSKVHVPVCSFLHRHPYSSPALYVVWVPVLATARFSPSWFSRLRATSLKQGISRHYLELVVHLCYVYYVWF